MRVYYSSYHLWAADHFARLAGDIEDAHNGRPRFDIKHRAYITNSLLSSVAFLEAVINELYKDAADNESSCLGALTQETRSLLAEFWDMGKFPTLDKYRMALLFCRKEPFNKGAAPYQDVRDVVTLRNTLVHYKPDTLGDDNAHSLDSKLSGRFPENKLASGSGNPYFPDKVLGRGCADWARSSVRNFANEFFSKIDVTPIYGAVTFNADP